MASGLLSFSFIIWALTTLFRLSNSEIFTALTHMTDFVSMEQSLLSALEEYVQFDPASPADVKRFANSVKKHIGRINEEDMELFLGHPVNSYLLVRRFYKEWKEIITKVNELVPQGRELHALIEEHESSFPGLQDLHGCVLAILRIQNVYQISAETIASGKLSHKTLSPELNAVDCLEMGYINHELKKYEVAYGWFMEAWKRLSLLDLDSGLTKKDVLEYLIWAEYKTGRIQGALDHTNELLKEDPENEEAQQGKLYYEYKLQVGEDMKEEEDEEEKTAEDAMQPEEFILHYEQLCRGSVNKSQAELDKLSCYYFNKHPLLVIRPVKLEMANLKPDIFLLHDVIRDKDIALIKKLAAPKLKRAYVTNRYTGNLEFADYRISKSAWLEDYESDVVSRLSLQLEALTGLSTARNHSEALQVVNYGIGGQYEPHLDHALTKKSAIFRMGMRNRIATVLIYMTDVEAGGSTVFLDAQAKIEARKGTAAFWFNLRKSGQSDGTTRHAACPVIVGTKWVANKWIHEDGQEFRRRCGLSPDE